MLTRITNQMMMASAQRNLQSSSAQLALRQDQASTLKAINRPSDDPVGTAAIAAGPRSGDGGGAIRTQHRLTVPPG